MLPYIYLCVPTYAIFSVIGLFFSVGLLYLRTVKFNIPFSYFFKLLIFDGIFLLLFSRLLFVLTVIPDIISNFSFELLFNYVFKGGIVFYGGLFGVVIGSCIFTKIPKNKDYITRKQLFNFFTPAIPLFHLFGRIGCFFGGCCFGKESSFGFYHLSTHTYRFPIQLVEALCNLFIFVLIIVLEKKKDGKVNLFSVYILSYASCRFIIEFFRGDTVRGIWFGLSTSQWISIFILSITFFVIIKNHYKTVSHNTEKEEKII